MKNTVTKGQFVDAFRDYGREDQFSYDALCALFDYLEDFEEQTGEEIELDPIAVCCEFSEYGSALECVEDCGYGFEPDPEDDEEDQEDAALEYLRENTMVIKFSWGIIIQDF